MADDEAVTNPTVVQRPRTPEGGDPYLGARIAERYQVIERIGEGGMGVVYLAEHVLIGKKVALKILSAAIAKSADLAARFHQEARAASKIRHENIIDITDFGETEQGAPYFVMEYLEGQDLARHLRRSGAMAPARAAKILVQVCRALGAAHHEGIVHRDLKPDNVFLVAGRPDFVKVLDFGIAKVSAVDESAARLTRTGMILGTPEYMAPEQARGDRIDHRADIYAAGCILYEMLTGDVPFKADSFLAILRRQKEDPPEPPTRRAPDAGISPSLEAVVLKALQKNRADRYQQMKEMAVALVEATGGDGRAAWGDQPGGVAPGLWAATPAGGEGGTPSVARRSRAPLVAGAIAVAAVAAIAIWRLGSRSEPVAAPPAAPTLSAPMTSPPAPAPGVKSVIGVLSEPDGADVMTGLERLGKTPLRLEFSPDTAPFEVTIEQRGFVTQRLRVQPDRSREYLVKMSTEARPALPPKSASKPRPVAPPPRRGPSELKDVE